MNTFSLRRHESGDIGWIISRHGEIYSKEYQWNAEFEALVAEVGANFLRNHDPERERCWIAERSASAEAMVTDFASSSAERISNHPKTVNSDRRIGSILLAKETEDIAKLRLLLVDPSARGSGLGLALIEECLNFARLAGYRSVTLWTQSNLLAARRLYERAGFVMVKSGPHRSFGHELVEEIWKLDL